MSFVAAFLLMAQTPNPEGVKLEFPIHHLRPSKVARLLNSVAVPGVFMLPNDAKSTLVLIGRKADIDETRARIALFDNAQRTLRLAVSVESPLNHAAWKGEIETANNGSWKGEDGDTDVHLKLSSRLNTDGTCTVFVEADSPETVPVKVVVTLKSNETWSSKLTAISGNPLGTSTGWEPRVSVRFLGR